MLQLFIRKSLVFSTLILPFISLLTQSALADNNDSQIINGTSSLNERYLSNTSLSNANLDDWGNDILGISSVPSSNGGKVKFVEMVRLNNASKEARTESLEAFEAELLKLTNRERSSAGLSPLRLSASLSRAAQLHAADMDNNNYFNHEGLDGSEPLIRARQEGYESGYIGENIAAGYSSPEETISQWMDSEGHRENILSSNYTEIGFGYSSGGGGEYGHYWVQVFGSR